MTEPLALNLPPELIDVIAERVAAILAERTPTTTNEGFLGVQDAAAYLSCPTSRIYSLVSAKRIPHHKDGSRLLFDRGELRQYVNDGGACRP